MYGYVVYTIVYNKSEQMCIHTNIYQLTMCVGVLRPCILYGSNTIVVKFQSRCMCVLLCGMFVRSCWLTISAHHHLSIPTPLARPKCRCRDGRSRPGANGFPCPSGCCSLALRGRIPIPKHNIYVMGIWRRIWSLLNTIRERRSRGPAVEDRGEKSI